MDTQLLKYIYDIASYGSINQAAQVNFISPSHLSRQLKKLEQELSIKIFDRSSLGMHLTKQGYEFLRFVRPILDSARSFEERYFRSSQPEDIFSFHIALHHSSLANQAAVELIEKKLDVCTFVDVIVDSYPSVEETLNAMRVYHYPLGVIQYSSVNVTKIQGLLRREQLRQTVVSTVQPYVLLSSDHPLASRAVLSGADLTEYARISFIDEDLSNFNDFTAINGVDFQSVRKRILVKERGQLFHYLKLLDSYYIGKICPSCIMQEGLVEIPMEQVDDSMIYTAAVYSSEAEKNSIFQHYIELMIRISNR